MRTIENKFIILLLLIATSLTSCGGSGESSSPTSASPEPVGSTSELTASTDFVFSTSWTMNVDVSTGGSNGYFSLCSDYEALGGGQYEVNFDSCLIRADVIAGLYSTSVSVTSDITNLIAVMIRYDDTDNPEFQEFNIVNGQSNLLWN